MENIFSTKPVIEFQAKLDMISEQLQALINEYGIKRGISMFIRNDGKVCFSIDVDEFR